MRNTNNNNHNNKFIFYILNSDKYLVNSFSSPYAQQL